MPSILQVGTGIYGLITAKTLLDDGFNLSLIDKGPEVGGNWSRSKLYPGMVSNGVHGSFHCSSVLSIQPHFVCSLLLARTSWTSSAFRMPEDDVPGNPGAMKGTTVCEYFEKLYHEYVAPRAASVRLETELLEMYPKTDEESGWLVKLKLKDGSVVEEAYDKVVLSTGAFFTPNLPDGLRNTQHLFHGLLIHSTDLAKSTEAILEQVPAATATGTSTKRVVVLGGAKSATDVVQLMVKQGRQTAWVFNKIKWIVPSARDTVKLARTSMASVLFPSLRLYSRLERFLHHTWIGARLIHRILGKFQGKFASELKIPPGSPLSPNSSFFWTGLNTGGRTEVTETNIPSLVASQNPQLELYDGVYGTSFSADGKSIILSDGREIECDVVIACTGYDSDCWPFINEDLKEKLGLTRRPPKPGFESRAEEFRKQFPSLRMNVPQEEFRQEPAYLVYNGIIPIGRLLERDLALTSGIGTIAAPGMSSEIVANWISSFFLRDKALVVPTPEEAERQTEEYNDWTRTRFPTVKHLFHGGLVRIPFFDDIRLNRQLMMEMGVNPWREKPMWFGLGWLLSERDPSDLKGLHEERLALRLKQDS